MTTINEDDFDKTNGAEALRALAGGGVFLAGDDGYDQARRPWALTVDLRPAAVVFPTNAEEVRRIVAAAAAEGLRVAPMATGHNAYPFGDLSDTVLVRMSEMTSVHVDGERSIARVQGGALWQPAVEKAAQHGAAVLHGSSPDVGVVGYSLGGGIGWYARRLGLAADSVTAVELVTADGVLVRADSTHEHELFWALRGGGAGNFGVVTALEMRMHPIATAYAGLLAWEMADAERVLRRWSDWAADAPDQVTTSYRHLQFPMLPEVPALFRGRRLVVIDGAVLGDDDFAQRLLAPLRELKPEIDTFARVPAAALSRLHMDPEGPTPALASSQLLGALPDAAVDAFLAASGADSGSTLLAAELRQLGGALGRAPRDGGVLGSIDAPFWVVAAGLLIPELAEQTSADAARLQAALAPYANGKSYLNGIDHQIDASTAFEPFAWERLQRLRHRLDPSGVLLANHPIPFR